MFNFSGDRKREEEAISKIEKLIYSEGYGASNPQIDTFKIVKEVFDIKCIIFKELTHGKLPSVFDINRKIIFLNPNLSKQEQKIEISRHITKHYYAKGTISTNKLISAFLIPPSVYNLLKNKDLSDKEILDIMGFSENEFLEKQIKKYNSKSCLKNKIKSFFVS